MRMKIDNGGIGLRKLLKGFFSDLIPFITHFYGKQDEGMRGTVGNVTQPGDFLQAEVGMWSSVALCLSPVKENFWKWSRVTVRVDHRQW